MAYDLFNAEYSGTGLGITCPETVRDVSKQEIPLIMRTLGGKGVIKVPYGNSGQGVYTITCQAQLDEFMKQDFAYDRFIVQSLIGNYRWSSETVRGKYYQVGTIPNKKRSIYVADLRMMLGATEKGFRPFAAYSRRAANPLIDNLEDDLDTDSMLVTNLVRKLGEDSWDTDQTRLILLDKKDFHKIGIGVDALISGYIQSVLAVIAVDKMAASLVTPKGRFRSRLFRSINEDPALLDEILLDSETSSPKE